MRRCARRSQGRGFPVAADPRWVPAAEGVLTFIREGGERTWQELYDWAERHAVSDEELRQLIAFLELPPLRVITSPDEPLVIAVRMTS